MSGAAVGASPFTRRIAGVVATRVVRFGVGFVTSLVLSRVLGPSGRGAYALATLAPTMLVNIGQLGLPSAFSFFAGRGRSGRRLQSVGIGMALALGLGSLAGIVVLLPWLQETVLRAAPADLVAVAMLSMPFQYLAAFAGATLIGRQSLRNYNLIVVGQSVAMLVLVVVLVGVLRLGAMGAVAANLIVAAGTAVAVGLELRRLLASDADDAARPTVRVGELVRFGLMNYPATVAGFVSYRADVFLLSAFLGDARALGLYSLAVSLAELLFFVPDSVGTVFFPRVAASERASADELTPAIARLTLLVTALSAIALIPAAFVIVHVILPDFRPSLTAFLVILPGILALALSKVLTSYIGGLGMPLRSASASGAAVVANLVANVVLIPRLGFVGAAAASLLSYTLQAVILLRIATGLSHKPVRAFVVPGRAEWATLIRVAGGFVAGMRGTRPDDDAEGPP